MKTKILCPSHLALALGLCLVVPTILSGCGDDEPAPSKDLLLRIFNSSPGDGQGFPPSIEEQIVEVRVRVYQNGRERGDLTRVFDFVEPSGRLPQLEFGENYQIVVEALGVGDNEILADGATPVFDYLADTNIGEIQVFTSALGSVEYATALFVSGSNVVSAPSEFEGPFVAGGLGLGPESLGGQRAGHTVTTLSDGRVAVIGGARLTSGGGLAGSPFANLVDTIEIYNPFTGYWSLVRNQDVDEGDEALPMRLSVGRAFHTATLIDDGVIAVVGGFELADGRMDASARVEIIDIAAGTIDILDNGFSDLLDARALHTAHWLDGRLYVMGGVGRSYAAPRYLDSVEVFDPANGFFERATDPGSGSDLLLVQPRAMHTAMTLVDGVLLLGGRTDAGVLSTMEFLELSDGTLSGYFDSAEILPRLATPRFGHAMVLMQPDFASSEGEPPRYIAVSGGYSAAGEGSDLLQGDALTNTVEFINERNFAVQSSLQQNMATPRAHHVMVETSITNDLFIMGGITTDNVTDTVERMLRTENGGFPLAPTSFDDTLELPRAFSAAVPLQTHNVMIIGGWEGGSSTSTCGDGRTAGCTSEVANPGDLWNLGFLY